ncbi:MAG: RDD family protein [Lachnospiraceae bacterium]|nr:RDD family protein [Lachnospiraceae bacterium]
MQTAFNNENRVYAGFFIRLAAFLLDMLLVNVLLLFIKVPVWIVQLIIGDSLLFSSVLFSYNIFDILYYLLTVGYFVLATYFCQTTLGKYLLRIRVVSADGQRLSFISVLMRETVGRYLSAIILYIGYMIAGWDNSKQGLHDRIADTYVVYRYQ